MRFCDIDRSGKIWKYAPYTHKTKHRGKIRLLAIGPKAQQILQPYFDQCLDADQFVFPRPKAKNINHWYGTVIADACKKAGIERWAPTQLRHAGGTIMLVIRRKIKPRPLQSQCPREGREESQERLGRKVDNPIRLFQIV